MDSIEVDLSTSDMGVYIQKYPEHSFNSYLVHLKKIEAALQALIQLEDRSGKKKSLTRQLKRIKSKRSQQCSWDVEKKRITVNAVYFIVVTLLCLIMKLTRHILSHLFR